MHGVSEPAEYVEVVPTFLVVATGRVVVDADLVAIAFVQFRIEVGLEDVFEHREFALLFGPERLRVVEHLTVAVAQDVGGKPAVQSQLARFEPGREDGFEQRLAGLKVFTANRHAALARELKKRRRVHREVRGAVGVGHAALQCGIGVDHARGDIRMVRPQALFERGQGLMDGAGLEKSFSRTAPDHHQALGAGGLAEIADVLHDLLSQVHLRFALLDILSLQVFDKPLLENGGHRLDPLEKILDGAEVLGFEHPGFDGRFVSVIVEQVPTAKLQVFEPRQGHEITDQRGAAFRPLAQTDPAHLGEGADGARQLSANGLNPCNESRRHGAHAGHQDSQFSFGFGDFHALLGHRS